MTPLEKWLLWLVGASIAMQCINGWFRNYRLYQIECILDAMNKALWRLADNSDKAI